MAVTVHFRRNAMRRQQPCSNTRNKQDKHSRHKSLTSLLRFFEGTTCSIELMTGKIFTGTLSSADDSMNLELDDCTVSSPQTTPSSNNQIVEPKEHKGTVERQWEARLLANVIAFVSREAKQLEIKSLPNVTQRLQDTNAIESSHISLHPQIIERAKEFMKSQCCVYLGSVSMSNANSRQTTGNLRCSIVYGRSVDNEKAIEP